MNDLNTCPQCESAILVEGICPNCGYGKPKTKERGRR